LSENVKVLTSENWKQEVLESQEPVLVDFWATWCPPCKRIAPEIDAVAEQLAGVVKVGKLDADASGDVAAAYNVQSIPTLLVFKGGEVVDQRLGFAPREELLRWMAEHTQPVAGVKA
jgi:thioredoxin 1